MIKKIFDKTNSRAVICAVCVLMIILTLAFIFRNSMASSQESFEQSDKVVLLLRPIIDPHGRLTDEQMSDIVRKSAHFVEFAALGLELAFFCHFAFSGIKLNHAIYSAAFSLLTADIDEFIQIYSERGSSVSDVFIDFSGAVTGIAICCGITSLVGYIRKKRAVKNSDPDDIT